MQEHGFGDGTENQIGDLLTYIDKLLDQLNQNFVALDRTMKSMSIDTVGTSEQALEQVFLLKNISDRLRTFEGEASTPNKRQMFQLLANARRLVSDGSRAWEKIGVDLIRVASESFTNPASDYSTQQRAMLSDSPITDRFHSDWVREPFTFSAFRSILSLPESSEKWLFLLRYFSDLTQAEIADLVGITAPALNMRTNRMLNSLSTAVVKSALQEIASNNRSMDITFGIEDDVPQRFSGSVSDELDIDLGFNLRAKISIIINSSDSMTRSRQIQTGQSGWFGSAQRFLQRAGDSREGPFIPVICVYDRREGEIFLFAAQRIVAANASLMDSGKFGPVLSDEELFPALHRQIQNVLSEQPSEGSQS